MDKKNLIINLMDVKSNITDQLNDKADINHSHDDLIGGVPEEHTHEIRDITGLEGVISNKSDIDHGHTINDLTDMPKSFPTNGGNADTIDNLTPSDFAKTDHEHSEYAKKDHIHQIDNISSLENEFVSMESSVNSGKNAIADAITNKGISASGSEDFSSLANKITQISGGAKRYDQMTINADRIDPSGNTSFTFNLGNYIPETRDSNYIVLVKLTLYLEGVSVSGSDRVYLVANDDAAADERTGFIGNFFPSDSSVTTSENHCLFKGTSQLTILSQNDEYTPSKNINIKCNKAYIRASAIAVTV